MATIFSNEVYGTCAIAGHVGCGHAHSLNNQVQDDSAGLSVVLSLFQEATGLSLMIKEVKSTAHEITVTLENGGTYTAYARRAITNFEKEMMKSLIGKEAINTHSLALEIFGRFFGQGVTETPVALQTAIANAALDGFRKNYPDQFIFTEEGYKNNCGYILGTVLNIDGIDVSVLATVNATKGGIGPDEDLEGNSVEGQKGDVIRALHMDSLPTLVIEAMIYSGFSEGLEENTYFVRADEEDDHVEVANAVVAACDRLNLPCHYHKSGMKRTKGALKTNTEKVAQKIIDLGEQLKQAEDSSDKVQIISQLAIVVSQDCGGISFMTNRLHERLGGGGMELNTSAVLNLVTTKEYNAKYPIPFLTSKELNEYVAITKETIKVCKECFI